MQAIDKAVGFAGKYGPIVKQMASDVARLYSREYLRAVADEDQSAIRRLEDKWARSVSPDTAMVLKMAGPPIDQISKKIDSLNVEDKAYLIGRVAGLVTFEVLLSIATSGTTAALKGTKAADSLFDVDKFRFVNVLDESGDIQRIVEKLAVRLSIIMHSNACFVAGTPVATQDGFKPIEELKVGDLVATRNEYAEGEDTDNEYQPVTELITTHPDELLELTLSSGESEETVTTTGNHPFYSLDEKQFIPADQLQPSSRLVSADGRVLTIQSISRRTSDDDQSFTTYNISVSGAHTYFVGRLQTWVHNMSLLPCKQAAEKFIRAVQDVADFSEKTKLARAMLQDLKKSYPKDYAGHYRQAIDEIFDQTKNSDQPLLTAEQAEKLKELAPNIGGWRAAANAAGELADAPFAPGSAGAAKVWTSIKSRLKAAQLPISGRMRFVPPKDYNPTNPLTRGPQNGYIDRFGNEWVRGPSRTADEAFEWDVQLSNRGREMLGWLSREGNHVNVSLRGIVTH